MKGDPAATTASAPDTFSSLKNTHALVKAYVDSAPGDEDQATRDVTTKTILGELNIHPGLRDLVNRLPDDVAKFFKDDAA